MRLTTIRISCLCACLAVGAPFVLAQRTYKFSANFTATGSADDNPRVEGSGTSLGSAAQGDFAFTYGFFPSISMESVGAHSSLEFNYRVGIQRFNTSDDLDFESHHFNFGWRAQLSERLTVDFTDSFAKSKDFGLGLDIPDIGFPPELLVALFGREAFDPVYLRRDSYFNNSALTFGYSLGPASDLSFGLGHTVRTYEDSPEASPLGDPFAASDQNRFSAFLRYSRKLDPRSTWALGYSVNHYDFKEFENSRSYNLNLGYNRQLTRSTSLRLGAGPSFRDSLSTGDDGWGYNAHFSIVQSIDDTDQFSLTYSRTHGDSIGVGATTNSHVIGLAYQRLLLGKALFDGGVRYYDSGDQIDVPSNLDGLSFSARLGYPLSDRWTVSLGAEYYDQNGVAELNFDRTRIFIAMSYSLPEFWRFRR